jgi:hypothetical protein
MSTKEDLSTFQSPSEFDVFEGEGSGLPTAGPSASASGVPWNLPTAFSVDTALTRAKGETKTLRDNLSKAEDLSEIFLAWNGVDPESKILDVVPRELLGVRDPTTSVRLLHVLEYSTCSRLRAFLTR